MDKNKITNDIDIVKNKVADIGSSVGATISSKTKIVKDNIEKKKEAYAYRTASESSATDEKISSEADYSVINESNETKNKLKEIAKKGSLAAASGIDRAKKGLSSAKTDVLKSADMIATKGRETQKSVLTYIDNKKNAKFLDAKLTSFRDGMKEGRIEAVDYIKKYTNFCLAATALSYYYARCDGSISEEEKIEIQFDLDSIIKNRDLPDELRNKLAEISNNKDISFEEVRIYLDGVSLETLYEFEKDIDEIIVADGNISYYESNAKKKFEEYLRAREGEECFEQCYRTDENQKQ